MGVEEGPLERLVGFEVEVLQWGTLMETYGDNESVQVGC